MNWLAFYLLAALHPVVFVFIARADITWTRRIFLWTAMLIPGTLYCWDYFAIQKEHERMCAEESGLRVYIQPEKMDRVRIVGDAREFSPKYILEKYYSKVRIVEALTEKTAPITGKPLQYYEAYTATPNPKAGQWVKGSLQEEKYLFLSTRLEALDGNVYELSKREAKIPHGLRTELILSKGGKIYAQHNQISHWWAGIKYPDAVPSWLCPDTNTRSPPKEEPNANYENWDYPLFPSDVMSDLIFK